MARGRQRVAGLKAGNLYSMPAYDNSAVAAKLELYADLLEISGADKYRFLSYKKAAKAIRAWPEQVSGLVTEGRLNEIPGVGAKMTAVVADLVERGTFAGMKEVCERYPASLAAVMRVPGVGPKRAALLHERLGVDTIEALEAALADGRVERLGGFGAKTAAKIASSLESHRRHMERTPIGEALPAAEQLVLAMRALRSVQEAGLAGSVRRRAETVGNIDVVVAAADPAGAAADLRQLPAIEAVLADEPGHLAVELHDGMRVDVRIVPEDRFEAALRYWTGSVAHNGAMETRAAEKGLHFVGEVLVGAAGPILVCDERGQYEALGLPWMPPEARELAGTVDLAAQGTLPRLIEIGDVLGDLQSHSTFTDGKGTLAQNRSVAAQLGYEYLAATDHAYALRMVGGLDLDDLERQWDEIDEINASSEGPRILKGIELNIAADGSLDYEDEVLARFEIVLASLHSGWDEDGKTVTERVLKAIEHPLVDIIAHPTGRVLGRRDPLKIDVDAMLAAAGETGTIMEINSYPDRLDLSDEHIRLARRYGVRFSLGTDAHAPEQLRYMPYGVAQARRGLVGADELLNAQPWDVARTWLKRNRALGSSPIVRARS